jgi:hypothetical protein
MSNTINWGKIYEKTAWGIGVVTNTISWGKIYANLVGLIPSFALDFANIDNDFTFTRNSSATFLNSSGLIETSAIDVPRIDYSTGEPAFLLEPQSTNLLPYSEDFTQSDWSKTRSTITPNATISPDGTLNADKLVCNADNNSHVVSELTNAGLNSAVVFSCFAKKSDYDYIVLRLTDNAANVNGGVNAYQVNFDLTNGTVVANEQFGGTSLNPFWGVEDYGNGWYRCHLGMTKGNDATRIDGAIYLLNRASPINNPIFLGDNISGTYIWGAQLEELPYATSYIPTNGSTVTRSAELCVDATPTINSEEGVLYAEINTKTDDTDKAISISDGSGNNRIWVGYSTSNKRVYSLVYSSNVLQAAMFKSLVNEEDFVKVACRYKENDFSLWVNGVKEGEDTVGITPLNMNELSFDLGATGGYFYGNTKDLKIYDKALTDDELAKLTTI